MPTVAALAGRRVDAENAETPRFPAASVALVRERLKQALEKEGATVLVCSAACGSDLLALEAAGDLGIRRRVILPFDAKRFRATSVTDRPGDWGTRFDQVIGDLQAKNDLVVLNAAGETAAYAAANDKILDEAQSVSRDEGNEVVAIIVWEGQARGDDDLTDAFGRDAGKRGIRVLEILTR